MTIKVFDSTTTSTTTIATTTADGARTVQRVTYDLSPPTHIESIKNAIVQRYGSRGSKRKSSYHPVVQRPLKKKATHDVNGGLPSPPVERALTPPPPPSPCAHRAISTCPSSSSMTVSEITTKLDQLKQEKHRLFQLIKRLVQEETEREQLR